VIAEKTENTSFNERLTFFMFATFLPIIFTIYKKQKKSSKKFYHGRNYNDPAAFFPSKIEH
jgi:hypothetical protein